METKTVREWFNTAEQPYKDKLFANTKDNILEVSKTSLAQAVSGAFPWDESPEKYDYWRDYVDSIRVPRGTN